MDLGSASAGRRQSKSPDGTVASGSDAVCYDTVWYNVNLQWAPTNSSTLFLFKGCSWFESSLIFF